MKTKFKQQLLHSFGKCYENAKDCKLQPSYFEENQADLKILSEYFGITHKQAFFLSLIFSIYFARKNPCFKSIIEYTDCNPMDLLSIKHEFDDLIERKFLVTKDRLSEENLKDYELNELMVEAFLNDQPMPTIETSNPNEVEFLLGELNQMYLDMSSSFKDKIKIYQHVGHVLSLKFPLFKEIKKLGLITSENVFFLILIYRSLRGYNKTSLSEILSEVAEGKYFEFNVLRSFMKGENKLIQLNFVRVVSVGGINGGVDVELTSAGVKWLKKYNVDVSCFRGNVNALLDPSDISQQDLLFNDKENEQLKFLEELLSPDRFANIQTKLLEKKLPKGIAILLHGAPGTGKTESVKQLAKRTGRKMMKVEISNSKSMWFGESEKLTKKIFEDYQYAAEDCEQTPILFFNEADAIFSKRMEIGSSNVARTENSVQNIILEEMENFEGILIATTNLTDNLDGAFERRFLFKIEFQQPDYSTKVAIWKSKFPELTPQEAEELAASFCFSGGQIENIKRKSEIHFIIYDLPINLPLLKKFCNQERIIQDSISIGFMKKVIA